MPTPPEATRRATEVVEVLTVGLPFCAFKLVVAAFLAPQLWGWLLLSLGVVDAVLNTVNFGSLLAVGRRVVSPCALALMTERLRFSSPEARRDLGNSLDVLLSFSLVAAMVGFGQLSRLPAWQLTMWNWAVVLNVLGAGVSRLGTSLKRIA